MHGRLRGQPHDAPGLHRPRRSHPAVEEGNTGDGHKMAMWAGAVMEDGPYAPMTHSLGTNSVGIDPFLMVNQDGKRFANEDVGAQELQNASSVRRAACRTRSSTASGKSSCRRCPSASAA